MQFNEERARTFARDYEKACGARLAQMRQARRLTQAQLANLAQISQGLLSYTEAGLRSPRLASQLKICAALACDHRDIWPEPDRILFARQAAA